MVENDRLLRACSGELVKPYPVWIMRQSGRYLPEYLEIKSEFNSFMDMIKDPETCAELALLPLRRYKDLLDAAILFTDILVLLVPIGFKFNMFPSKGIIFEKLLTNKGQVKDLNFEFDVEKELAFVFEAVRTTVRKLDDKVPLIGFSGSPFTLFCYMVEGGSTQSSHSFSRTKTFMYNNVTETHYILENLSNIIVEYLTQQIKNGVQVVQIFDTNAGILSTFDFEEFCTRYYKQILTKFRGIKSNQDVPVILFAKGFNDIEILKNIGFDVISVDWTFKFPENKIQNITFQGNLDPCVLFGSKDFIVKQTNKMLNHVFKDQPLVVNLGHGILPNHDPDHLKWFLQAVKDYKRPNGVQAKYI